MSYSPTGGTRGTIKGASNLKNSSIELFTSTAGILKLFFLSVCEQFITADMNISVYNSGRGACAEDMQHSCLLSKTV